MNRKTILSLLLAVMLLLSLGACEGDGESTATPSAVGTQDTPAATGSDTPEEKAPASSTEATGTNKPAKKEDKAVEITALSASPLSLSVGKSATLSVSITPADATDKALTYASSDPAIAKVSAGGSVTGVKAGSATITITAANGVKTTASVTVKAAKVVEVTALSASPLSLSVGKSAALSVSITPADATDKTLTYASSDPSVATVSGGGSVTGVKAGSATITITAANGVKTTAQVTVSAARQEATSMSVFPDTMTLYAGESSAFSTTLKPANATTAVSYTSSNTAVATVDASGTVSAVSAGSATITVSTDNGMSISVPVTVVEKESTAGAAGTFDYDWCQQVLTLVNQERAAEGLSALSYQSSRQDLADTRAIEIVSDFSHNGARNCNGENIASGQSSPEAVMAAWMKSPGHRANILTADFTSMVVSCYQVDGRYYWVQLFFI